MASLLKIKRSEVSGNPPSLGVGELAYSNADYISVEGGGRLYVGMGTETNGNASLHLVIGGKYFTDKLDHTPGTLTATSAIIVDENSKIDVINVDNLTLDGNTLSSTNTNGNILIDPVGTGYVQIVGTNAFVIPVGTSNQRGTNVQGAIRYNSEISQFEGYSGTAWSSLGGVRSVDGQTFITAELTPAAGDDTLRFYTDGTLRMSLDTTTLDISSTITRVNINTTTASTSTTTGALVVDGGVGIAGALYVGSSITAQSATFLEINNTPIGNTTPSTGAFTRVDVDNIRIDGNTISSTNADGDINITPDGTGKTIIGNLYIGEKDIVEFVQDITGGQIIAGEGIDVLYDDPNGTTTISAELASDTNRGVASFDNIDFTVTSGNVTLNVERVEDIVDNLIVEGEGIDITYNDALNTLTFDAEIATTSNRGVASFATEDFNVTDGAVELKDTVIKGITTDTGALTPANHGISVFGGEGIDVTHSGSTITVAGELATTSNIGVASFDSGDFIVTAGQVSIKTAGVGNAQLENSSVTFGSTTVSLGGTSTSLAGLTELSVDNINVNGNVISATNNNGSITLLPNGDGSVDVSGSRITTLGTPSQPSDAATKEYVDEVAQGLKALPAAKGATTANLDATYANGGLSATLTSTSNGAFPTIDDVTYEVGDNILVKDQTNAAHNGSYVLTTLGDASNPWVLTRCDFCNESSEIAGSFEFVQNGTLYGNTGWVATVENGATFVIGTDDINWVQFSGAGTYLPGDGLALDGVTFDVLLSNTGGLEFTGANAITLKQSVAGNGLIITDGVLDIVGTSDRISVSADAIDIASTYVGQTSITTLGTIGTGTWQGTIVSPTYGGTGVNNGSSTITIGGNLTFSGAFATTINVTGTTNVTMPTTGTLATLTNSETISNKTITNSSIGSTDPSTAAFTTLTANNLVTFTDVTDATALGTASVVLSGGMSVAKSIYMGGDLVGAGVEISSIDNFTIDGGTY